MNLAEEIFRRATPSAPAILTPTRTVTYADLDTLSSQAAATFPPVPRIALLHPDGVDYIVQALAILRSGATFIPVPPELAPPERKTLLRTTAANMLVEPESVSSLLAPAVDSLAPVPLALRAAPRSECSLPRAFPGPDTLHEKNHPAFIRFSSGTTGTSKGVLISHDTLLARIEAANAGLRITAGDRVIWILPMAHHFAVSIMLYLWNGAATILPDRHLAADILASARQHQATVFYGSPFHHQLLAAEKSGDPWPTLRLSVSTAARLPAETSRAFASRYNLSPSQGLGVIECGLPCLNLDDPAGRPESIGRPLPGFEVEIRDPDPQGIGQLHLRGPGFLDAYLSPPRTRAEVLDAEGWFATGDLARQDADGFLYLEGRTASVINVGGLKCFPEEIEAVLVLHEAVLEARVFPKLNPQFGTIPVAEIRPADPNNPPSTALLARYCRERLARYKVPLEFRIVTAIARTPSGKIKRIPAS